MWNGNKRIGVTMEFNEIMVNILIGIASGAFSSIIVSVIFFIITNEQSDKAEAKSMAYPLYLIFILSSDIITPNNSNNINIEEGLKNAFAELSDNFSRYEPWKFKGRLKKVMIEIYELVMEGYQYKGIKNKNIEIIKIKSEHLINIIEDYERNFAKYCFQNIINNIVIKITLIILVLLIIVLVIA